MAEDAKVPISVVYALAERQIVIRLDVEPGTTVAQVVALSGLARRFAQIDASPLQCAIFGRIVSLTQQVAAGDRVEILRPLLIDPKEQRRQAVAHAKRK